MRRGELVTLERTAASGHDLDAREEATLTQAIDKHRRRTAVAELQEALLNGSADARRRAAAVARGPGYRLPTRLKAMAATLFPGLVAAQLRRRRRGVWTSGGGMRIERS